MGTATSFRRACLLFAAVELRVFPAISEGAASAEEVAGAIGLNRLSTRILLDGLAAMEILLVRNKKYAIAPSHRRFLLDGPDSAVPDIVRCARENRIWLEITHILRSGGEVPSAYSRELLDSKIGGFPALMRFNRLNAEAVLAEIKPDAEAARNVLDMGGGDGIFADLILSLNSKVQMVILEQEGGADLCTDSLGDQIGSGRLQILLGDARYFRADIQFDLILINELLELYGAEDKARIVRCAAETLSPKGRIVVVKFTLDSTGIAPLPSALFSIRMHLKAGGYLESDSEVISLLQEAGCKNVRHLELANAKSIFIAGREHDEIKCANKLL